MNRSLPSITDHFSTLLNHAPRVKSLRLTTTFESGVLPPALEEWLARLSLLYGVPFEHLVPNGAMVPEESIRFFYVDPNWISCLLDGALSVGAHSSRDTGLIKTAYTQIVESVQAAVPLVRRRLAKAEIPGAVEVSPSIAGLLIRSQLISGWPGLEIAAYENYTTDSHQIIVPGTKIDILRMERLSPDTLLCLFAKLPQLVQLNEPKEGLSFGTLSDGTIGARYIGYQDDQPVGVFIMDQDRMQTAPVVKRTGGKNVVDVLATRNGLRDILRKFNALGSNEELLPAAFAIQMIKAAEQQSFVNGSTPTPNPKDCTNY
jgi:hypothetical protein